MNLDFAKMCWPEVQLRLQTQKRFHRTRASRQDVGSFVKSQRSRNGAGPASFFGSAEASQMHQSILKKPRNLKDIDVRFTEIYRRVEYHGSIFWWG